MNLFLLWLTYWIGFIVLTCFFVLFFSWGIHNVWGILILDSTGIKLPFKSVVGAVLITGLMSSAYFAGTEEKPDHVKHFVDIARVTMPITIVVIAKILDLLL
jgi:hypothetical protein